MKSASSIERNFFPAPHNRTRLGLTFFLPSPKLLLIRGLFFPCLFVKVIDQFDPFELGVCLTALLIVAEPPVGRFSGRRKSVFAEAYDPEEDEDDGSKVIFPKSDEQRQRLAEAVRNILLFRALDKEQMQEVLDAMFERVVEEGDLVIKQGDDGDNFYVIQNGIFHALVGEPGQEPKHIHTYENSGSFGELALLYNMPRAATIKAHTDGSLWAMDRQTFRRILLKSAFKKRKMYESLIESVPMLKTLQPYERMNLADALVPKTYTSGDRIIKQGDAADGMYFVEDGVVIISVLDDSGKEVEINRLGKGGYFGELALVTHRPRAASAYAEAEVKLACEYRE
jgi:cAMP-dependent protein kinase regulator